MRAAVLISLTVLGSAALLLALGPRAHADTATPVCKTVTNALVNPLAGDIQKELMAQRADGRTVSHFELTGNGNAIVCSW